MSARLRRIMADGEQIKKDFANHKYIKIVPVGEDPVEKYKVVYFVDGINRLADGKIEIINRHEVEITLHADYPRYKPICKISTPIYHPNFRDGQICIGDIWGAGESLTDIIVNIGDMIQYKSWNSTSPLSAEAANWAIENKNLFPIGKIDLYVSEEKTEEVQTKNELNPTDQPIENDFEITAEELEGITFVPTSERMQGMKPQTHGAKINLKTILVKGILWALIGGILGFAIGEIVDQFNVKKMLASMAGDTHLAEYYHYSTLEDKAWDKFYNSYKIYCITHFMDYNDTDNFSTWYDEFASEELLEIYEEYSEYEELANDAAYESYLNEFDEDVDEYGEALKFAGRADTAVWSMFVALLIGLMLGIGEGIFYGSAKHAIKYGLIGGAIAIVTGFVSGFFAQWLYSTLTADDTGFILQAIFRGIGWSVMGLGIGLGVGVIKPQLKRIAFCSVGGLLGGFFGGVFFEVFVNVIPFDLIARGLSIIFMGLLIGLGVGLLEQFAKQAWLKVVRGEFEGKEYLVFNGITSIGNNNTNTIVLFKDKLVGEHHCEIKQEGGQYILVDCGTPLGTVVNGKKITRHVLHKGDSIAIGNSVLVFNTK